MQKKICRLIIGLFLLSTSIVSANEKIKLLSADETLSKSERKVILGLTQLGLKKQTFSFPVFYTPAGKKAITVPIGKWDVALTQNYANTILNNNYPFLISQRYDKLIFGNKETIILSATKDIKIKTTNFSNFLPINGNYDSFLKQQSIFLNNEIAKKIVPILSIAKDVRYSEMNDIEAQTFIKSQAKEVAIPAVLLQKLLTSAYAFSLYMSKPQGEIYISQHQYKDKKGHIITNYTTTFYAPITLFLNINRFDKDRFILISKINSKAAQDTNFLASMFENIAKNSSDSLSISTSFMPTKKNAQKMFEEVIELSFKNNIIALSTKLKKDRNFAITAPIQNIQKKVVYLEIGNQEDIRVDHPFKILREEDGKEILVGYIKTTKVGNSCLALPQNKRTLTQAQMINNEDVEIADLALEYPWTGVFGSLNYEYNAGTFQNKGIGSIDQTKTGATNMLYLEFNNDLGYILNSSSLSEWWFHMGFGLGIASFHNLRAYTDNQYTFKASEKNGFAFDFKLGINKRYYISHNIYLSGGITTDFDIQSYSYNNVTYNDASLNLMTWSLTPEIRVGYISNPNLDFFTSFGVNIPLATGASFIYNKGDNTLDMKDTYNKNMALNIKVGVNVHLDFAGPFANIFASPSKQCDKLKK